MKKSILSIRLNEPVKEALEIKCRAQGISISKGAREAVQQYTLNNKINDNMTIDTSLIFSLSFSELMFWLLDKLRDPEICEDESYFKQQLDFIDEFRNDSYCNDDILIELMKVYYELDELLNLQTHDYMTFKFPKVFNYDKLHEFMHTIRYDNQNNKILFIK